MAAPQWITKIIFFCFAWRKCMEESDFTILLRAPVRTADTRRSGGRWDAPLGQPNTPWTRVYKCTVFGFQRSASVLLRSGLGGAAHMNIACSDAPCTGLAHRGGAGASLLLVWLGVAHPIKRRSLGRKQLGWLRRFRVRYHTGHTSSFTRDAPCPRHGSLCRYTVHTWSISHVR